NHSCRPNTAYKGLNLVALHPILPGQELTLDYADLLNESAETFECQCGTPDCRKTISGMAGNSVTQKEQISRQN
ncbi:MAG: SET domain-containing protein, partial [Chitinophagaceae bacterium]|nr:SET domain-containing protein [Chitinophagaceae bacterium]